MHLFSAILLIQKFQAKLIEFKKRIHDLEMQLRGDGSKHDAKAAQIELQFLHEKLERSNERGKKTCNGSWLFLDH